MSDRDFTAIMPAVPATQRALGRQNRRACGRGPDVLAAILGDRRGLAGLGYDHFLL